MSTGTIDQTMYIHVITGEATPPARGVWRRRSRAAHARLASLGPAW